MTLSEAESIYYLYDDSDEWYEARMVLAACGMLPRSGQRPQAGHGGAMLPHIGQSDLSFAVAAAVCGAGL